MVLQRAFNLTLTLLLLLLGVSLSSAERQIDGTASDNTYIHSETDVDLGKTSWENDYEVNVTSNVPVTVQRYTFSGLMGNEAVPQGFAKVLVTSDCSTAETEVLASVSSSPDGSIDVTLSNLPDGEDGADYDFLEEPSWYSTFWTYLNSFCGGDPFGSPSTPASVVAYVPQGDSCSIQVMGAIPVMMMKEERQFVMEGDEDQMGIPMGMPLPPEFDEGMPAMGMDAMPAEGMPAMGMDVMPSYDAAMAMPLPTMVLKCEVDTFCKLDPGVCSSPGEFEGSCETMPQACMEMYDPVCGCDGQTYSNDCKANVQGASVAYKGKCEEMPVMTLTVPGGDMACMDLWDPVCGTDGVTYSNDCYAKVEGIRVASIGECEKMPDMTMPGGGMMMCTEQYEPVCGSDGRTYSNECKAKVQGVSVASIGECEEMPDNMTGGGMMCTEQYEPVCGSDGRTYSNDCKAKVQGISVAYEGECVVLVVRDCEEKGYCRDPKGTCLEEVNCLDNPCDTEGCDEGELCTANYCGGCHAVCTALPPPVMVQPAVEDCPVGQCRDRNLRCANEAECEDDPCSTVRCAEGTRCESNICGGCQATCVSGIDLIQTLPPDDLQCLIEFGNDSTVTSKSVAATTDCGEKDFCKVDDGTCTNVPGTISAAWGVCTLKPEVCSFEFAQVCGCDGVTYSNPCGAYNAGVNVKSKGECSEPPAMIVSKPAIVDGSKPEPCQLSASDEFSVPCGTDEFCQLEQGVCMNKSMFHTGVCVMPGRPCDEMWNPVCGCDGNTYGNTCKAHEAMVSVKVPGECDSDSGLPSNVDMIENQDEVSCEVGIAAESRNTACGTDEFCQLADGLCNDLSNVQSGICAKKPDMCTFDMKPVCGCDGLTYSNACAAETSGVSVSSTGECLLTAVVVTAPDLVAEIVTLPDKCGINGPCSEVGTSCSIGTESCCGQIFDSLTCDCERMGDGTLQYMCMYTEACMVPPCCMNGSPEGMPPPADGTCNPGSLCNSGIADDYCCSNIMGTSGGTFCSKTGGLTVDELPDKAASEASTTVASTSGTTTESTTAEPSNSPTGSSSGDPPEGATSTAATTVASTSGTTATTVTQNFKIDGDFPTAAPNATSGTDGASTASPFTENVDDPDRSTGSSSTFNRPRSFSFCVATTLMALALISVIFPGGENNHIWGFGKFAVAAMAVSSLYSKKSPTTKGGNIRKTNQRPKSRELIEPICHFNVEVLIDGCSHSLNVAAPSVRIVDVVKENHESQVSSDDPCVTENEADLMFPVTDMTQNMGLGKAGSINVPSKKYDSQCAKMVIGRPFVDATGGSLQAMPLISSEEVEPAASALSWTGETVMESRASPSNNTTAQGRFLLGEDWTQRALGEHASVASFSAFSIALMTNQAPSKLVDAALKAGLDEIRHAKTSFDIASKLTGMDVGPGPLPESKHKFGQDLKSLAMAVAREGCVEETLSTFAAAVEVEHISEVLEQGVQDSPYSGIDHDLLTIIRSELVTIAKDESNHSALAWRTLNWVCGVDSHVCDAVHRDVFEESDLEMRFNQRAEGSFGKTGIVLRSMRDEWTKIFNAHKLTLAGLGDEADMELVCGADIVEAGEDHNDKTLVDSVTENVIRQVVCS